MHYMNPLAFLIIMPGLLYNEYPFAGFAVMFGSFALNLILLRKIYKK